MTWQGERDPPAKLRGRNVCTNQSCRESEKCCSLSVFCKARSITANMTFLSDESPGVKADQKLFCRPFCQPSNLCVILPGLFIGNFKDARDVEQLSKNNITHILSIHDSARPMLEGVKYLCIPAADSPSQNLARHFRESIKFIHECRLTGEGCLVHCLAGVSRSVTLVVAYIMTITDFGWEDALSVVRAARSCANPNMGFQRQLQDFEKHDVDQFRQWLKEEYGENSSQDLQEAKNLLSKYKEQAELQQNTGGRQWNNNFSSVPSLSYSNYTTET
ncbi:dual specificity protein phosphatase 22 isoform 1-T1 [Alca torda]